MTTNSIATAWIIAGLVLIFVEFFAPYLILVFLGIAALITGGLILLGLPQQSAIPFAVFAGLSLVLLVTLRKVAKRLLVGLTSDEAKTEPGFEDIIGSEAKVLSGFTKEDLRGRVFFRGADWNAVATEALHRGDRVRILSRNGHNLEVEKIP